MLKIIVISYLAAMILAGFLITASIAFEETKTGKIFEKIGGFLLKSLFLLAFLISAIPFIFFGQLWDAIKKVLGKFHYIAILPLFLFFGCKSPCPIIESNTSSETKQTELIIERDTITEYAIQFNSTVAAKKSYLKTDLSWSYAEVDTTGQLRHSIANFGKIPSKVITKNTNTVINRTKTLTIEDIRKIKQLKKDIAKSKTETYIAIAFCAAFAFSALLILFRQRK